eukprot:scaffold50225_cov57-Phaeocystis_antarctica.AAC.3
MASVTQGGTPAARPRCRGSRRASSAPPPPPPWEEKGGMDRMMDGWRRVDVLDLVPRALDAPLHPYAAQLVDHVRVKLLAVLERLLEGELGRVQPHAPQDTHPSCNPAHYGLQP